jgi:hypothetical protein
MHFGAAFIGSLSENTCDQDSFTLQTRQAELGFVFIVTVGHSSGDGARALVDDPSAALDGNKDISALIVIVPKLRRAQSALVTGVLLVAWH